MPGSVWIDGNLVDAEGATVSVFDHGLTVGDGVFETMKVVDGPHGPVAFALGRHLARLRRSAAGLGLEVPHGDDVLRNACAAVVAGSPGAGRLRLTLTGGLGPLGSGRGGQGPTVVIAAGPPIERGPTERAVIAPWTRNERSAVAGLKTTSYAENVRALAWAAERGAGEAIFLTTAGRVSEGTGSNLFAVVGDELVTPPLDDACLAGVTRALVIELTGASERHLGVDELLGADEAFLTSSLRDVHPLAAVDARTYGPPGSRTLDAAAALVALRAHDIDP